MHSPPHQEVSHQFQEATGRWTQTGNNPETPGHWRDLHLHAVPLVGWPHHHLQICPQVCRVILAEFQDEYLHCSDNPDE